MLSGNDNTDVSNPALWADEKYLQPVLEDDALLYNLDELIPPDAESGPSSLNDDLGAGHRTAAQRALQ